MSYRTYLLSYITFKLNFKDNYVDLYCFTYLWNQLLYLARLSKRQAISHLTEA